MNPPREKFETFCNSASSSQLMADVSSYTVAGICEKTFRYFDGACAKVLQYVLLNDTMIQSRWQPCSQGFRPAHASVLNAIWVERIAWERECADGCFTISFPKPAIL